MPGRATRNGDHHRDRDTFRKDIARIRRIEQAGWLVLRFTADDVFRTPADTARTIAAARRRRTALSQRRPGEPDRGGDARRS
ncbi:DUF559 domain-containing protein [Catenuloplanes sp. NPDC051500]|uniref:DUF559 domain-containing protein n=1 Tax=Catenuloplanes sp. NPDC051500 TaxID=3363959 RepID=UPI0037939E74